MMKTTPRQFALIVICILFLTACSSKAHIGHWEGTDDHDNFTEITLFEDNTYTQKVIIPSLGLNIDSRGSYKIDGSKMTLYPVKSSSTSTQEPIIFEFKVDENTFTMNFEGEEQVLQKSPSP